jgi:hypothetical protein
MAGQLPRALDKSNIAASFQLSNELFSGLGGARSNFLYQDRTIALLYG